MALTILSHNVIRIGQYLVLSFPTRHGSSPRGGKGWVGYHQVTSQVFYHCALIDSSTFFEGVLVPEESSVCVCVVSKYRTKGK